MKYYYEILIAFFIIIGIVKTLQGKTSGAFQDYDLARINVISDDDNQQENYDFDSLIGSEEENYNCWGQPCETNSAFTSGLTEEVEYEISDFNHFFEVDEPLEYNDLHDCYSTKKSKVYTNQQQNKNLYSIVNADVCLSLMTQAYKETGEIRILEVSFWGFYDKQLKAKSNKEGSTFYPVELRKLEFKQIKNQIFLNSDSGYLLNRLPSKS